MEFERLGSPPPPSDTGVEITAGVHWLTLTIWGGSVPEVEALVVSHFFAGHAGESLWELMGGARYFDARYELAGYDVTIYAGPAGKRRGSEEYLSIEIKGSALERLGSDGLKSLMTDLSVRWQVTSSRIDVALDGAPFTPEWFEDQCEAGNLRSRVKRAPESEWLSGSWTRSGQERNRTVYLGSRQSDKHLRVYDRRGFTRCELECRRDAATALVRILDSIAVEEWPAILTLVSASLSRKPRISPSHEAPGEVRRVGVSGGDTWMGSGAPSTGFGCERGHCLACAFWSRCSPVDRSSACDCAERCRGPS